MGTKLTRSDIDKRLTEIGSNLSLCSDYVNARTKVTLNCSNGHTWLTYLHNVLRGSGCPHCSGLAKLSKEILNERLAKQGIELVGEYTSVNDRSLFRCECGHEWNALPHKIIGGSKCPMCRDASQYGFDVTKPAYFYIVEFQGFIKYGITNSPASRLYRHRAQGMVRVIDQKRFDKGVDAKLTEQKVKILLGGNYVSKDQLPDGYTETLPASKLPDLLRLVA